MILPKYWSPTKKLMVLGAMAGGKAVEDTATGNPVTFQTDLAKPLKHLIVNFLPIQSSGTPTPQDEHPITGWTGLDVMHGADQTDYDTYPVTFPAVGRNLLDEINGQTFGRYIRYTSPTSAEWRPSADSLSYRLKVKPSTTYTISVGNDNVTAFRVCALKNGANNESSTNAYQWESGNMVCTITTASDENYLIVQISKAILEAHTGQIMVEEGSTAHAYEPYTNTIYGGYVDLVTGEVWKTWENVDLGSLNWTYQAESTRFFSNGISSATKKPKGNGVASSALCEIYKTVALTQLADKTFAVATSGNYFIKDTDYTDKDELITAITGKYLAYELATPTLITTLSPTQINAIKGNNTVWSDGNGDCEVTFLKKG